MGDASAQTRRVEKVLLGIQGQGLGKKIPKKVTSQNVVNALPGSTTHNSDILKLLEAQQQQLQKMQDMAVF